jgi:serine/threonine-protein kinase
MSGSSECYDTVEDLSGQTIKGYELIERIGAGGFGVVYRALQPSVKREVAIKVILPEFADRPDFIERLETEAQLVARLEHPSSFRCTTTGETTKAHSS